MSVPRPQKREVFHGTVYAGGWRIGGTPPVLIGLASRFRHRGVMVLLVPDREEPPGWTGEGVSDLNGVRVVFDNAR